MKKILVPFLVAVPLAATAQDVVVLQDGYTGPLAKAPAYDTVNLEDLISPTYNFTGDLSATVDPATGGVTVNYVGDGSDDATQQIQWTAGTYNGATRTIDLGVIGDDGGTATISIDASALVSPPVTVAGDGIGITGGTGPADPYIITHTPSEPSVVTETSPGVWLHSAGGVDTTITDTNTFGTSDGLTATFPDGTSLTAGNTSSLAVDVAAGSITHSAGDGSAPVTVRFDPPDTNSRGDYLRWVDSGDGCTPAIPAAPNSTNQIYHSINPDGDSYIFSFGVWQRTSISANSGVIVADTPAETVSLGDAELAAAFAANGTGAPFILASKSFTRTNNGCAAVTYDVEFNAEPQIIARGGNHITLFYRVAATNTASWSGRGGRSSVRDTGLYPPGFGDLDFDSAAQMRSVGIVPVGGSVTFAVDVVMEFTAPYTSDPVNGVSINNVNMGGLFQRAKNGTIRDLN